MLQETITATKDNALTLQSCNVDLKRDTCKEIEYGPASLQSRNPLLRFSTNPPRLGSSTGRLEHVNIKNTIHGEVVLHNYTYMF